MKHAGLLELVLLAAIWGASFLFMRIGTPEFGPLLFMALRTAIAGLFLLPFLLIYRQQSSLFGQWRHILVASLFNTSIPFALFGYATLSLTAGVTSILNATTPMFAALVAYLWLNDKLSKSSLLGLVIGFIGVYLLMSDKIAMQQQQLLPTLAVLAATLCYGIGANYTKTHLSQVKPLALATSSQLCASVCLLPFGLATLPAVMPSNDGIAAVLIIGILCTGIAYVLFFRLIAELGAAKAVSVTYLIPAFGLLWGALFLQEQITLSIVLGSVVILFGVGLTTGTFQRLIKFPTGKMNEPR
jgi:drug/metabolite transporter (DMT)-like permease